MLRDEPWRAWLAATRPRSWPVAPAPVLVGTAAAWQDRGAVDIGLALLALAAAWLMQVITNLQNDVGYTVRIGAAGGRRHGGLPRATAQGWLAVRRVQQAVLGLSALATALGLWMVVLRGWPVLLIGVVSLAGALAYMGGPRPIAYTPFGELSVFVFFGPVAVLGTQWLLAGQVSVSGLAAGACVGAWSAAALCINNQRDIDHDRANGRRTFAVRFGAARSRQLFVALMVGPALLCLALLAWTRSAGWCLPLLGLPAVVRCCRALYAGCPTPAAFNALLFRVFRLGLIEAALLAAGLVLWPA